MNKEEVDKILVWSDHSNRLDHFISIKNELKGELYWYALKMAYMGSDNLYQYREYLKNLFLEDEPFREQLMSLDEKKYFDKLPSKFIIYRGMTVEEEEYGEYGISWTLDKKIAEFFAQDYRRNIDTNHLPKTVVSMMVSKSDIIAYFNDRDEKEVIALV